METKIIQTSSNIKVEAYGEQKKIVNSLTLPNLATLCLDSCMYNRHCIFAASTVIHPGANAWQFREEKKINKCE